VKLRADEHISPEIVRAVREMALSPGWELSHVYDDGHGGYGDVSWITKFARAGGKAILTADTDFHKRHNQIMAVWDTGLAVVHFPAKWANSKCRMQAAHTLFWWERIEALLANAHPRQCWRVPWEFSTTGEFKQVKIDYDKARKKLQRAKQRTG
jgi:hypothetical protein